MYSISVSDKQLYVEGKFSLKGIMEAYKLRDPRLAEYVVKLCIIDPAPPKKEQKNTVSPISYKQFRLQYHKDAIDPKVLHNIQVPDFGSKKRPHQKKRQQKAQLFTQRFDEFTRNASMIPERLKMGEFLIMLYEDTSLYAQEQFREVMRYVPLKWGPWQAFKYVLRRGLTDQRWSTFAVLYDRLCSSEAYIKTNRWYRGSLPSSVFPVESDTIDWGSSWSFSSRATANDLTTETYIFFTRRIHHLIQRQFYSLDDSLKEALLEPMIIEDTHFSSRYTRNEYKNVVSRWAHQLLWTKGSAQLMRIFQHAKAPAASQWALQELIENHHSTLVQLSPEWIVEKGCSRNTEPSIKKFIGHWITDPITKIPKNEFLSNGIFRVVLAFIFDNKTFGSRSTKQKVQRYACAFVREFLYELKDAIGFDRVLWLLRNRSDELHELGLYLLFPEGERKSPFAEELTLDFWTDFLGDARLHSYAVQAIEKNFSKRELSKEWIKGRLYDSDSKIVLLAKEYIAEGRHEANIDWYDVFLANLFGNPGAKDLTQWAWGYLKKIGPDGESMLSRFTPEEYRKLVVHSDKKMRTLAYEAYENEHISPEDFSIRFLRCFIHHDEYQEREWKSFFSQECTHSYRLPIDLRDFCIKVLKNRLDCTVENLGYRWVLKNRKNTSRAYEFVHRLFREEFPVYQLALLDPQVEEGALHDTPQSRGQACQGILDTIHQEYNQNSSKCVFWREFLLSRLARFRQEKGVKELKEECIIDASFFSFAWFKKEIVQNKARRLFALSIGELFLTDWIAQEKKFGFTELEPLLLSRHSDVAQFTINVIRNPSSRNAVIDISGAQFTPEELYEYIFSDNPSARRQGVQIIYGNLEKFAQPDKLVQLTYSPDPFVRAMVISIMYQIAKIPQVTPQWSVYEDSVIPNNSNVASHKRIRTKRVNPKAGERISSQKILGAGTGENLVPVLSDYDALIDFATRELFRIPKNPPKKKNNKASKSKTEKVSSWKTKRTLMEAFRDLSLQDRAFAQRMIPIFQELILYKGTLIRDMALSSLAYIEKQYEQEPLAALSFLTELSVQEPETDNT